MNELLKADIFFVIASIGTIISVAVITIVAVYIVKLIKKIDQLTDTINREAAFVTADIHEFRQKIKDKAGTLSSLLGAFTTVRAAKKIIGVIKKR